MVSLPSLVFLVTLGVMLLRPPDVDFYHLDRIAFGVLVLTVLLRVAVLKQELPFMGGTSFAMFALLGLALSGTLAQPFDNLTWSVLAAKFLVPFTLFHLAGLALADSRCWRQLEVFLLAALAYLSFIAIASLADAKSLIFPRYILDESLGTHFERARGPFLQAVANGVTLNLLGLLALNTFRRRRLPSVLAVVFLVSLPLAILATMTRAVWLSFAGSILIILLVSHHRRLRRACWALVVLGILGMMTVMASDRRRTRFTDRLAEEGPVEIRMAIYQASWDMVREKSLLGWGQNQMCSEVARRLPDYHLDVFCAHNNYLEILVEHGVTGLVLYVWIVISLFRLGRGQAGERGPIPDCVFDREFRKLWPILLGVYLFNGMFVVMNYQFVNAVLFTIAGILASQNKRSRQRYVIAS